MLEKASEIKQNKRRETLIENKDKALLSRKLVTLKNDVPIKNELSSFILKDVNKENLFNFLREMEFNRLLSQAISFYGEDKKNRSNKKSENKNTSKIKTNLYKSITNEQELNKLITKLNEKKLISVDTETTSLNPIEADLVGVSFSCDVNEAYYIPIAHKNFNNPDKKLVINKIKKILEDPSIKKVGQNIKYDLIVLKSTALMLIPSKIQCYFPILWMQEVIDTTWILYLNYI